VVSRGAFLRIIVSLREESGLISTRNEIDQGLMTGLKAGQVLQGYGYLNLDST